MTHLRRLLDHLGNAIGTWLPVDDYSAKMHAAIDAHPDLDSEGRRHMHALWHWSTVLAAAAVGAVWGSALVGLAVCVKALLAGNPSIMAFVFGPFTAGAGLLWWHRWPAAGWVLIATGTAVGLRYLVAGW